ncbi:MAG: hypothetical protein ABH812_01005 [bacterium]
MVERDISTAAQEARIPAALQAIADARIIQDRTGINTRAVRREAERNLNEAVQEARNDALKRRRGFGIGDPINLFKGAVSKPPREYRTGNDETIIYR